MKLDLSVLEPELRNAVLDIVSLVRDAGGRALMVGGSVRDLVLGVKDVKDVDLEVYGVEPETLEKIIGSRYEFDPCGVSFGVLKIKRLDIDISLPRRESKRGEGHRGFMLDADPNLTIPEAASRRDFTINAMYYDPLAEELIDPYGGLKDLEGRILRHVSEKFKEDPLRVLRGMQFIARFDLKPAPETIAICREVDIEGLPPERLFEEWAKLLTKGVAIRRGLDFLRDVGWVRYFPELERLIGCKQDPEWHPEGDAWVHTGHALDYFAQHRTGDEDDLIVGLAVLCHDLGKPMTTKFEGGRLRSLGHEEAGLEPTLSFLRRITNEERILKEVPPLVTNHMVPYSLWKSQAGDSAIRRLAVKVVRIDRLLRVCRADGWGRPPSKPRCVDVDWLEEKANQLAVGKSVSKPIVQGRDLIALGYKPSVKFGKWLSACFEAQLDGKFVDHDGGMRFLQGIIDHVDK